MYIGSRREFIKEMAAHEILKNRHRIIKRAYDALADAEEHEADALYKEIDENFKTFKNTYKTIPVQVWLVHDALYLDKQIAEIFEDGKDDATRHYIIVKAGEEVREGACYHSLYDTEEEAWEQMKEDGEEARKVYKWEAETAFRYGDKVTEGLVKEQQRYEEKHKDNDCEWCGKNNEGSVLDVAGNKIIMHYGMWNINGKCNYCHKIGGKVVKENK